MFCRDKELIINGEVVRSPEQQVYKNMKDIKELQTKVKPIYLTSEALTSSSVSVPTADTNIGDATEGWLLTDDALLFRIDGNDGTTVLLTFASDFNGPAGPTPNITVNATVGATVGTPTVTVVQTGTPEDPTLTFNFNNLKGEPGDNLITVQVVDSLPASGTPGILYFVANGSGESQNAYDEFIYNNGQWEKLGQAQIDLSNYVQKSNTSGLIKNDGTIDTTQYFNSANIKIIPPTEFSMTSGYCVLTNDGLGYTNALVSFCYQTNLPNGKYILTPQIAPNGTVNVYVRDYNGNIPPDQTICLQGVLFK